MLRKRLGVLGLAFALATTSVLGSSVGITQVYAQEEAVTEQAEDIDLYTFLGLLTPGNLVEITVKDETERAVIQEEVDKIIADKTDQEAKAQAIYNWVCKNVNHRTNVGSTEEISNDPYGVFTSKLGVCGGISNLLREMMHMANIPCVAVAGWVPSAGDTGGHQWNAIYVNDAWVEVDATNKFYGVDSMIKTYVPETVMDVAISYGDLQLGFYDGLAVVGANSNKVQIPNEYEGQPITSVSADVFSLFSTVEEIEINANILHVEISTLKSSGKIKNISVLEGNPNFASHQGALFNSDYSQLLVYPKASDRTDFTIPKQTENIDVKEMFEAPKLKNLQVDPDNPSYSSYDGALYNKDQTKLLYVPVGKTTVRILDTAQIDDLAFCNIEQGKLTVIAKSGSPAAEYASRLQLTVQEPEDTTEPEEGNEGSNPEQGDTDKKEMDVRAFLGLCTNDSLLKVTVEGKEKEEMLQKVNELIKDIEKPYDKAKAIYNWVAAEVEYISDQSVAISAEPYDVFSSKKGVCGGFSNLLREMMHLAGIPAVAISGNYGQGLPHQWNAVYAGDRWVYADATATGNDLFDVASLDNTHHALEILDVTIDLEDLQLGYYGGLAVVSSTDSEVTIPEKYQEYPVTALSYRLFGYDSNVEEIEINNNIINLDENTISTMKGSPTLREIRVLEGNKNYASRDGVLFSADYSALLVYPSAAALTSFTLPAQTNNVDIKDAFSSPNLENINVEKDSQDFSSYEGALYNKNQSTLLCVPAGKTSIRVLDTAGISEQAFANTDRDKLTIIAASASPAAEFARKNDYKLQVTDEVKVTFNDENNELIIEWNVIIGETVTPPQVTEREGYTFLGWFTENGEQPFDFSTAITETLVLTQRWEAKNEEGGSVSGNTPGGSISGNTPGGNVSGNETPGGSVSGNTPGGSVSGNTPGGSVSENEVPEGIWGVVIGDKEYNGKKQTRLILVYDGKKLLREKVDYTISYKNNINSAVYTQEELNSWLEASEKGSAREKKEANKKLNSLPQAVIKMKGNYSGTESVYFQILPKSISGNDIAAQDLYVTYKVNKEQKPTPVISWNGKKLGKKDFKVVTYENKEINFVGKENETVTIPLTIEGTGNYTGTTTVDLTIAQSKTTFDMNKVKVTIKGAAKYKVSWEDWKKMDYKLSEADIAVKNGNSEVSKDSYQITGYVNHRQAGTATVILQGKKENGYHGRKLVTFQIAGTSMSEVDVYSETNHDYKKVGYPYTGKNVMLLEQNGIYVAMKNNKEQKLTLGEEFTASYGACIEKGTVTLELVGNPEKGFTGSKKITYKIAQEDLTNAALSFEAENTPAKIMKGGAKPEVQLMLGEKQLTEGRDYTLTYKKNKDVTDGAKTAEVLIKGKGNFKGSITKKFVIEKKGIEEGATVATKDLVSKNGSWKQSFKVYDADGKELKANKDYVKEAKYEKAVSGNDGSVSYEEVSSVQPGDVIRITVTGMGNYAGSGAEASVVTGTYRILQENYDISKAKIVIAPQLYNGDKVELTLDQKVFTKAEIVKGKQVISLFDQEGKACFEIVQGSYQKNDRKGTAKVILRGTGSFGGEKTVTFKINSRATSGIWKGVYEQFFSFLLDFTG